MLVPDGVFVADGTGADDRPRFVEQEAPSDEEVAALLSKLAKRVTKMLRAHGRMLDDDCDEETEPQLMFAGRPAPMSSGLKHEEALPARCARQEGYSLHAGRQVHENDRVGPSAVGALWIAAGPVAGAPERGRRRHGPVRDEATLLRWQADAALRAQGAAVAVVRARPAARLSHGALPRHLRSACQGEVRTDGPRHARLPGNTLSV